jgi:hypothetical protein
MTNDELKQTIEAAQQKVLALTDAYSALSAAAESARTATDGVSHAIIKLRSELRSLQVQALEQGVDLDTPYADGWNAYLAGVIKTECPEYGQDDGKIADWLRGWEAHASKLKFGS